MFHLSEPGIRHRRDDRLVGTFIMPKHIYDTPEYDWATNPANFQPVGTGPFKFVSYEKKRRDPHGPQRRLLPRARRILTN